MSEDRNVIDNPIRATFKKFTQESDTDMKEIYRQELIRILEICQETGVTKDLKDALKNTAFRNWFHYSKDVTEKLRDNLKSASTTNPQENEQSEYSRHLKLFMKPKLEETLKIQSKLIRFIQEEQMTDRYNEDSEEHKIKNNFLNQIINYKKAKNESLDNKEMLDMMLLKGCFDLGTDPAAYKKTLFSGLLSHKMIDLIDIIDPSWKDKPAPGQPNLPPKKLK